MYYWLTGNDKILGGGNWLKEPEDLGLKGSTVNGEEEEEED